MSDVERIAQTYSPFDQDETLPPPPWKPTDPALVAWEKAHGHDVRLKCYPEFGCQVIEQALEREIERLLAALARRDAAIQAVRDVCDWADDENRSVTHSGARWPTLVSANRIRAAIAAEMESKP